MLLLCGLMMKLGDADCLAGSEVQVREPNDFDFESV
jgi:hypothetical protein